MLFLYNFALFLYEKLIKTAAFFGKTKAQAWVNGRDNIFEKIAEALNKRPQKATTIWIHVASLGEFEQGRPIIEKLKKDTPPQYPYIFLTFFSPSGYEIQKKYPFADNVFYLPLDTAANAKRFLDLVQPDLAIFVKYEFWYHYLTALHQRNIPTLLVSAIFREKQFSTFNPYSALFKKTLSSIHHFFVQNEKSLQILHNQGFANVSVAGDTRIDRVYTIAKEGAALEKIADFTRHFPTFVGGSTWQPDEEIIVTILDNPLFKDWKFIFAPHDIAPNNIKRLQKLLENKAKTCLYSEYDEKISPDTRVLIINNIGMLSRLYRYGHIAYIGGGFGAGIHNTLEPIAHGLPVIFGKKYQKFAEAVALVASKGGFTIENKHDFLTIMSQLLDRQHYENAANAAQTLISDNLGASQKIVDYIQQKNR